MFTTHHSPLTLKTPWQHFQRLLIVLVRFMVPARPSPPPPRKFSAFPVTDVTKRIGIKALITNTVTFRCNLGGENRTFTIMFVH